MKLIIFVKGVFALSIFPILSSLFINVSYLQSFQLNQLTIKQKKHWKDLIYLGLAYSLAAFVISFNLLGNVLFSLNASQLDRSGDGFKNYFTFAYHYQFGNGLWFNGMQYPFGDLLTYGDAQPAVLLPFLYLKKLGLDFSGYELFIVQFLPILSIVLGGVLLHKIMRYYKVPEKWIFISITFCLALSPQLYRFNAHFSLAYLFCFPFIWYLLIQFENHKLSSLKYISITAGSLFLLGFIHPYHILICSLFLMSYFAVSAINRKPNYPVIVAALFSIGIFLFINHLLDPYSDRPQNPYGIWNYKTEISDLFPFYGWLKYLSADLGLRNKYYEGYAYIGIMLMGFPILYLISRFKKLKIEKSMNNHFLWASLLMLLFGMGLHLILTNKLILDWLPPLKQFRSLGRFSWAFYYIAFVASAAFAFHFVAALKKPVYKYMILSLVSFFWLIDAFAYGDHFKNNFRKYMSGNELIENTELSDALKRNNIDPQDFQAILPLPISLEGAEKLSIKDDWMVKTRVMPLSFQSGLPMMGAYMSRTSLSNILSTQTLVGSVYLQKEENHLFDSKKEFLIISNKEEKHIFNDILSRAQFIDSTKRTFIYRISPKNLFFQKKLSPTSLNKSLEPLYYNSFKNNKNLGLKDQGGQMIESQFELLDINTPDSTHQFTASIWTRIDPDKSSVPKFKIQFFNSNNKIVKTINYRDKNLKRIEVIGNWAQVKYEFNTPPNTTRFKWLIEAENLFVDHALISVKDSSFHIKLDDEYYIYNHYIAQLN